MIPDGGNGGSTNVVEGVGSLITSLPAFSFVRSGFDGNAGEGENVKTAEGACSTFLVCNGGKLKIGDGPADGNVNFKGFSVLVPEGSSGLFSGGG